MDEEFEDDLEDDFDEIILENAAECPECLFVTGHTILKEKAVGTGADYLLKCNECDKVHNLQVREPKAVKISFMLSEGPNTRMADVEIDEDEVIVIGDIFEHDDASWEINRIEDKENNSVTKCDATAISRANALRSDMVMVRLTLTRGEYSESDSITVERDTVFKAGSIMTHKEQKWRIRAIHTGSGRTMTGRVDAYDIKRIYLHEPPRPEENIPYTPRERRQAWKEGRLGNNPNPVIPDAEKSGKPKQRHRTNRRKKKRD